MVRPHTLSINIKRDKEYKLEYINTPNSNQVFKHIIESYKKGIHAFTVIGSYGTGKSSFLWAFEQHFLGKGIFDYNSSLFKQSSCESLLIVGEYSSFTDSLASNLAIDKKSKDKESAILNSIYKKIQQTKKSGKTFLILIDEFGKYLEYAAKHNPEKELFFIQQFAELVSDVTKDVILIVTLHQDFSGYAHSLTPSQRNEWEKVKGRFKEITFNEPVEQMLLLISERLKLNSKSHQNPNSEKLFKVIENSKIYPLRDYLSLPFAKSLLPFDILTAATLTLALQRYGQNERSIFSFLHSSDPYSLTDFEGDGFYNLSNLYDYLHHNFYSFLNVKFNPHYAQWQAMRSALERSDAIFGSHRHHDKVIKIIGLLNIFAGVSAKIDKEFLVGYLKFSLGVQGGDQIIKDLDANKIIRFKKFNQRYVLFEGTDIDIELAIDEAGKLTEKVSDIAYYLKQHFDFPFVSARAISIKKGTPRFFQFHISSEPENLTPVDETDGYINLIFSTNLKDRDVLSYSSLCEEAVLFGLFHNTDEISNFLYEINKTKKAIEIHADDKIAVREFKDVVRHNINLLNHAVLDKIYSGDNTISWFFQGKKIKIDGRKALNSFLSEMCERVYHKAPEYRNELINRTKYSSQILVARRTLIKKLLKNAANPDLGFSASEFPPEKTIYLTLIKSTGIHAKKDNSFILKTPDNKDLLLLWREGIDFLEKAKAGKINAQDLVDIFSKKPYKLKKGFIDFWLAIFFIVNKDEYALFSESSYIPEVKEDSLELLLRNPRDFYIKTFNLSGVRLEMFNKYRGLINAKDTIIPRSDTFIETIRPFIKFYNDLNYYAKNTKKVSIKAQQFRKVIATATDPEKTFFEDFPEAFGYSSTELQKDALKLENYINEIKAAIKTIRSSYDGLVNRFEAHIIDKIVGDEISFNDLKKQLQNRFANVKAHLLSSTQKQFYDRVFSNIASRNPFLNALAQACVGKSLENFTDNDEALLYEKFSELVRDLDNISELSEHTFDSKTEDLFKLEITHLFNDVQQQIVRLPKSKTEEIDKQTTKIQKLLGGDKQINISILTKLLIEQIK